MLKKLFILFFITSSVNTFAQNLYNNDALISIEEGTIFSIGQDAYNNGTIINNGNFLISGTWINNGTYNPGVGDFTLNSPNEQIVNHNAQSFQRLVISGGGPKIFQADLSIEDRLELVDGILYSENGAKLIVNDNASVTGGSENAYIVGTLYLPNSIELVFPIGTESAYLPVILTDIEGDAGLIGFSLAEPNPILVSTGNIASVTEDFAWIRHDSLGSVTSAVVTLPVINQSFDNMENVVVLEASDVNEDYINAGGTEHTGTVADGTVTSERPVTGNILSLGEVSDDLAPPITVVNAVTPAIDGMHDFLRIENIEAYPDNNVKIFNRWGDLVWEIKGYDNQERRFSGKGNKGGAGDLESGTYYYAIEYSGESMAGFFVLRR